MSDFYEQIVDAIVELHGRHPGYRAAHAKGNYCAGTFVPTSEAARLSRAAHLRGEPVSVMVRFSNGSGNPELPDNDRTDGRGMAVKFELPDGTATDSVCLSLPVFFVHGPEDFLEFTRARAPDPETGQPDGARIGEFLATHPETAAALERIAPSLGPPRSYATCAYNSLHAFALVDAEGERRWARFRWEPEAGEEKLPEEEIAGPDFLRLELRERLSRGTISFRFMARLAAEGDPLEDPTVPWPEERESVELGRLEIREAIEDPERPGEPVVFDPMRLIEGIEPSGDRILATRPHAYTVSVARRGFDPRS